MVLGKCVILHYMKNTPTESTVNVQILTNTYAKAVEAVLQKAYDFMEKEKRPIVSVEVGRKYFKLVTAHPRYRDHLWVADTGQRSVHSFVDRVTGDVLKAASWVAPAKGARYNVVTGMDGLLASVDPYGSYLYLK